MGPESSSQDSVWTKAKSRRQDLLYGDLPLGHFLSFANMALFRGSRGDGVHSRGASALLVAAVGITCYLESLQ